MIASIVLVLIAALYRIVADALIAGGGDAAWLANFTPLAAIALCGAIFLPKRLGLWLPMVALFVSDLVINARYGVGFDVEMSIRYLLLLVIGGMGFFLRDRAHIGAVLMASVAGSSLFYAVTNSFSWLTEPAYAKTGAGWIQALTVGLPGFPPTWVFFRNTLLSDLLFTLLFVGCVAISRSRRSQPAELGARGTLQAPAFSPNRP